jgi:hypothetical protein
VFCSVCFIFLWTLWLCCDKNEHGSSYME